MKKFCLLVIILMFFNCVKSQQVNSGEYFFDTDPGTGNAFPIGSILFGDTVNFTKNISVAGLGSGYHIIYVRLRSNNGVWGIPDSRLVFVYDTLNSLTPLSLNTSPLKKCEYFFDTDPGQGNGNLFNILNWPDTVNTSRNISVAGLSIGFHLLFTRIQDSLGNWSMPESRLFTVIDTVEPIRVNPVQSSRLNKYQYRFDTITNPDYIITFNKVDSVYNLLSVPVNTLSNGMHKIILNLIDSAGKKSFSEVQQFRVCSSLPAAPTINGSNVINICNGAALNLFATPAFGSSIIWHGPNGFKDTATHIAIANFNQSNSGNYYAHSITGAGVCDTSAAVVITVNGNALPTLAPLMVMGSSGFCVGSNIRLLIPPQNGNSYRWLLNSINTANNADTLNSLQITTSGTYKVRVTNEFGCSLLTPDTIIVLSPRPVTGAIIGNTNALINSVQTYVIPKTPGSTYNWFVNKGLIKSGNGTDSITVQWSASVGSAYIKLVETNVGGCNGDTLVLAINLSGFTLIVNPTHILAPKIGSTTIVNITSNGTWTVSSGQAWVSLSHSNGMGNDSLNVTVMANATFVIRSAIVTFTSGSLTRFLTVSQNPTLPDSLTLSTDTIYAPYTGNNKNVGVISNRSWTVSSNQPWALVNIGNGSGNGNFYVYTLNNTGSDRSGLITVTAGSTIRTVYVLQRSNSTAVLNYINENSKFIRVFPNPSTGSLTITSNKNNINGITVYDITGKVVYKVNVHLSQEFIADLSGLPNGIYFMQVTDEKGTVNNIKIVLAKE